MPQNFVDSCDFGREEGTATEGSKERQGRIVGDTKIQKFFQTAKE